MRKGSQIALTGHIQTGSYDAKDGTKRYTTDVIVESFEFVGGKKENAEPNSNFDEDMIPVDDGDMPFN